MTGPDGGFDPDLADPDVKFWLGQIDSASKWHRDWYDSGRKVLDRYMNHTFNAIEAPLSFKMSTLWSNVQTIYPALYAQTATPSVSRRFKDRDPVGRWAAIVLERVEAYELDTYDDDYNYRSAIEDYLLPGRGQIWVYYDPTLEGESNNLRNPKRLAWECCKVRHINWKDFLTNPARTWDEVWWVAKREYLTKEEAKAQRLDVSSMTFEVQKTEKQYSDGTGTADAQETLKKAAVWEIWSKTHKKTYFVSKNSPKILREPVAPTLKFQEFFPCPRPLTTTTTPDSIIPVPDYVQYQDQAREIDRLTQRVNLLTKALRVAGVYDSSQDAIGRLLEDTETNTLIPCETYAVLAGQGGVEGSISFFPIKDIVIALKQCYESRAQALEVMYQITGISDIVRGASDPNETATAQQIKNQWGGLRIRDKQREVQRFIRDTFRLKAQVHAQMFQPETLKAMSNVPLATSQEKAQLQQRVQMQEQAKQMAQQNPQAAQAIAQQNHGLAQQLMKPLTTKEQEQLIEPAWDEVVALLRNSEMRGFAVDVETDSTVMADEMAEKQARTEFTTAMTSFVEAWGPIIQSNPKSATMAGELLLFNARAFKTADTLETAIEEFVDQMEKAPPAPPPGEGQDTSAADMAKVQVMAQEHQDNHALEQQRLQFDAQKAQTDQQIAQISAQKELQLEQMKLQHESELAAREEAFERWKVEFENSVKIQTALISAGKNSGGPVEEATTAASENIIQALEGHTASVQEAITTSMQGLSDAHQQTLSQVMGMMQKMNGPKRVVRGVDGRVSGVEPVVMQ